MKILKRILLLIILITFFGCSSSGNIVKGNLYKLSTKLDFSGKKFAIFPFKSSSEGKTFTSRVSTDGNAIADILTIQMMYKGYEVVEREKLNKVFEESKLSLSGLVESGKNLSDFEEISGVDYIVYGSVIQYEYVAEDGKWNISLGVTARFIHVKSGNLVLVCTSTSQGDNISNALDGISLAITDALKEEKVYVWQ
ncbi:MAG: hypothetical protein K8R79_09440 [Calditrichales bacterium]|nr:hypothetical protein [Calditrichales bacterium]